MRSSHGGRHRTAIGLLGSTALLLAATAAPATARRAVLGPPPCTVVNATSMAKTSNLGTAIAAAHAGDELQIRGTCRGHFTVTVPLTLHGFGPSVTLDGGGSGGTVLAIDVPSGTVTVEFLKITGGAATKGGGIAADGGATGALTVNLVDDRVTADTAAFAGAGLYGTGVAALNISTTLFSSDTIPVGANGAEGAAIATDGKVDLYNSNIIGNGATAAPGKRVLGGALYLTGASTLNVVKLEKTTVSGGEVDGGALAATAASSIIDSTVSGNRATTTAGRIAGAAVEATGPSLEVQDTSISSNLASTGAGAIHGVGIDLRGATSLDLVHSSVLSNRASSASGLVVGVGISAGGSATLQGSGVARNAGTSTNGDVEGGGIASGGSLSFSDGPITGNSVSSTTGWADGGGIWTTAAAGIGASAVTGNSASTAGGGVFLLGAPLTVSGSRILGDTAPTGGGIDNVGGSVTATGSLIVGCVGCTGP